MLEFPPILDAGSSLAAGLVFIKSVFYFAKVSKPRGRLRFRWHLLELGKCSNLWIHGSPNPCILQTIATNFWNPWTMCCWLLKGRMPFSIVRGLWIDQQLFHFGSIQENPSSNFYIWFIPRCLAAAVIIAGIDTSLVHFAALCILDIWISKHKE